MIGLVVAAFAGRYAMEHNHPDLRWETVDTEHFAIHYPVSRRDPGHKRYLSGARTAQRLAHVADDVWFRLCTAIETFPDERVHVVILEDLDELEGFTLPSQDWIVFSGNPGPELHRMRGRMEWTSDLLAHELAHVLTLNRSNWLGGAASSFGVELGGLVESESTQIGVSVEALNDIPYWFSEGAAEYWSEVAGYNWWTSARERTLRTSVLGGRLLAESEWRSEAVLEDWYDPERAYQQGYAFHRWFADEFGDEAWREVIRSSGKRLRLDWTRIFLEVTGESLTDLKTRFEADLVARVNAQVSGLKTKGLVEGDEMSIWSLRWEEKELRTRDRWALRDPGYREDRRESTGTTLLHASYSPDGRWFARNRSGLIEVKRVDEGMWVPFAEEVPDWKLTAVQRDRNSQLGMYLGGRFASDLDFVPGEDALVYVGWEGSERVQVGPSTYEWTQLYRLDLTPKTRRVAHKEGSLEVETVGPRRRRRRTPIPGTLRAVDPSVSPDGQWLAYLHYGDGTTNLVVSRMDGTERRQLTHFDDGTWIQGTDWSPDGRQIVVSMHRHHQQNLWVADVETGELTALMRDRWEESDPTWDQDGSIWFSADVDGVFDIFRRSSSGQVHQMTRVVTGAQSPSLTPSGNLLYTHFTGFGWKTYGLQRSRLLWEEVSDRFGSAEPDVVPGPRLADRPVRPYRPLRSITGLAAAPLLRVDRNADGQIVPRVGAYLKVRDAVEVNTLALQGWVGADAYASGAYSWHRLWPDVSISGAHWVGRRSGDPEKRAVSQGSLDITLPWRNDVEFSAALSAYLVSEEGSNGRLGATVSSRVITVGMETGNADRLQRRSESYGVATEFYASRGETCAGESCEPYHRAEAFLRTQDGGSNGGRTIFDLALGVTDRSVNGEDALRAGGDHPYALRLGYVQGSVAFPGYAPFALSGSLLGVTGLAYRVPIARQLHAPVGPLLVNAIYVSLGGHIGTVTEWGSLPIYADGVAEVRMVGALFGGRWDSALRFAWGRDTAIAPGGPRLMVSLGTGF